MENPEQKTEPLKKLYLSKPPNEVFLYKKIGENEMAIQQPGENLPMAQSERILVLDRSKGIDGVTYPEEGGQYVWHVGKQYPRKGHVYPDALRDCYFPKRILIEFLGALTYKNMIPFFLVFGLMPKRIKGKILEQFIERYSNICGTLLKQHFLEPRFYTDICREIAQPVMTLLTEFGVSDMKASEFALVIITMLEYDMAYRLRIEDLLTETTKEKLLADPVGEARRLIKILAERDPNRPHLVDKFNRFAKLLKYAFFFIRKPFRKALEPVDFSKMQLDEIDRYHVHHWTGYNWFGMTIEERVKRWPVESFPSYQLVREQKVATN